MDISVLDFEKELLTGWSLKLAEATVCELGSWERGSEQPPGLLGMINELERHCDMAFELGLLLFQEAFKREVCKL